MILAAIDFGTVTSRLLIGKIVSRPNDSANGHTASCANKDDAGFTSGRTPNSRTCDFAVKNNSKKNVEKNSELASTCDNHLEIQTLARKTIITDMGEGLALTGRISDAAISRICSAVCEFNDIIAKTHESACSIPANENMTQGFPILASDAGITQGFPVLASDAGVTQGFPVLACDAGMAQGFPILASDTGITRSIPVLAVATAAMRDAINSADVIAALANFGVDVSIISGKREAELSFAGTLSGFNSLEINDEPLMSVDVGGGSSEVIIGAQLTGARQHSFPEARQPSENFPEAQCLSATLTKPQQPSVFAAHSFPFGSRKLTDLFLREDPPSASERALATQWVAEQILPFFNSFSQTPQHKAIKHQAPKRMFAVAGSATSAITIRDALEPYDSKKVHGASISICELDSIIAHLSSLPLAKRKQVVGLHPKRAGIIIGGLLILQQTMHAANLTKMTVSETDILQGILLDHYQEILQSR
ncbi:MAG: hypothetical protein LBG97_09065 [Coriobacteriales bacterium]|jgi:exopolyphosphatase/guanosine-5'-triphosphate,3'-diphosphate pyrophosphatase|nr:hypothetical protein [Coriobacteriales bacterium]